MNLLDAGISILLNNKTFDIASLSITRPSSGGAMVHHQITIFLHFEFNSLVVTDDFLSRQEPFSVRKGHFRLGKGEGAEGDQGVCG